MELDDNKEIREFDLFRLHDNEDIKPNSWICAGGRNLKIILIRILVEICDSTNISKTSIMETVAKNLNCPFSNIKRVIYPRKTIPLPVILELLNLWSIKLNKSEAELIDKKKELQVSFEILKSNFSLAKPMKANKKLSLNLAKICGAHAADGWINIRHRRNGYLSYDFALREGDIKSVKAFKNWIKIEFDCTINKRLPGCYSIEFSNKIFLRYLHMFFGFPYGKKSDIVDEPTIIKSSNLNFRKAFALGVMTFDGAVCKNNVGLVTKSKNLRDSLIEIVQLDKITRVYFPYCPDKLNRWRFYSSRSRKNKEFISWLNYFEKGTDKYYRLSCIIKRNNNVM